MDNEMILFESSMEDSFIYKQFNASNALINRLVKYIRSGAVLDRTYFEDKYIQMKRTSITPLARKVMDAYDNGDIELLYSKTEKIGISMPFIVRRSNGKVVATIFISSFSPLDKDDNLTIPVKQLYALMESAYIAHQITTDGIKIQRNIQLMNICSSVYSQMFMRILNKEYALNMDKTLYDKVNYTVTRFFLEKVWEYPNQSLISNYASRDMLEISQMDLELTQQAYNDNHIGDLNDMIKFVSSLSPRMSELNTRYFIEKYVNTYHGSSILSMDYLPYVFFVIVNVIIGSFLISQTALGDIIKNTKDINKFYSELMKIL